MRGMYPTRGDSGYSTVNRRRVLATAGTCFLGGVAGCLGGQTDGDGGDTSDLQSQLDTIRRATSDFADPTDAMEEGFRVFGPYVPGMGWHFLHPGRGKRIAEEGFSLENPNLLTYAETDSGLELASAEFGAPAEAVPENPDIFADEDADGDATEEWHEHTAATHVFATGDGSAQQPSEVPFEDWVTNENWAAFRPPDEDLAAGDSASLNWGTETGKEGDRSERVVDVASSHPTLNTLHVWVHVENPDGVFSPVNPALMDEAGHSH